MSGRPDGVFAADLRRPVLAVAVGLGGALGLTLGPSCNALTGADDVEIEPPGQGGTTTAAGSPTGTAGGAPTGTRTGTPAGGGGGAGPADAGTDGETDAAPTDGGTDALDPDGDEDLDGVPNGTDNCVADFNPCQYDRDDDGVGDPCDGTCEEHCSVRTCDWPDAQGCNCGGCPSGYRCVWDSHYENGRYGDVDLPDGGTYHCDNEWYEVCAEICSPTDACSIGTCLDLGSGCICFSFAMLPPCE